MHINPNVLCPPWRTPQGPHCLQNMKNAADSPPHKPHTTKTSTCAPWPTGWPLQPTPNHAARHPRPSQRVTPQVTTFKRSILSTKGHQNLPNRRPRPSQNFQISRVPAPMMGTDTKPNSGRRHKTHQTQSMAAWATTRMRKVYISQNTEIVVQK